MTRTPRRPFRSRDWFADPERSDMTALYLERFMNYGLTPEELRSGRPIIGIAQTGSDLSPCNRIHVDLARRVREGIRDAFDGFDPEIVARYGEDDIQRLLNDPRIIRSRAKIKAAIRGAQIWLEMRDKGEDFSEWLWSFVGGEPIHASFADYRQAPTQTAESVAMAKALKKRGFNFCGPVIVYAFMQAVGMVNDHQTTCARHRQVQAL